MDDIREIFNNRELAVVFWCLVLICTALFMPKMGPANRRLFKAFFHRKIIILLGLAAVYSVLVIFPFYKIGLWNDTLLKATILWYWFSAFPLLMHRITSKADESWWKIIREHLTAIAILEYIVNMYSFGLITELIMLPVLALIIGMLAVGDNKDRKERNAMIFLNGVLSIWGLCVLGYSIHKIVENLHSVATFKTAADFLLPIWLTGSFIPFAILTTMYARYEERKSQPVRRLR